MALFPPIVASSMPAFNINTNEVKIYFTLSSYNQLSDIKKVHISVRRQSSNVNVLVDNQEILERDFYSDEIPRVPNEYYVILKGTDIQKSGGQDNETGFQANALYKVQLRLSEKSYDGSQGDMTEYHEFFTNGIDFFSEWSTVCIIKPINPPDFYINEFYYEGLEEDEENQNFSLTSSLADFVGVFKTQNSTQVLKSWRIRILKNSFDVNTINSIPANQVLADSKWQITSAYNYTSDSANLSFDCHLPYEFTSEYNKYYLLFEINTKNDFYDYKLYPFQYDGIIISFIEGGKIESFINAEEGYVKLIITNTERSLNNMVLRRSDSSQNFLNWKDILFFKGVEEKVYYDFTIESGLLYKYCVQKVDPYGRRSEPVTSSKILVEFEHPFLLETTGNGDISKAKQLKLKYDFQISSYKTNVLESKTDTIGSQFPYIKRNGDLYYRSFPCTGTITAFMDDSALFENKNKLYPEEGQIGLKGRDQFYNNQYNYVYERRFREKVEEFLYNAKPKLYKSTQEGNILIKLMEVSLTPKQELNRLIYTFSATAYEIDKPTIENLELYDFITVGTYNPNLRQYTQTIGQLSSFNNDGSVKVYKAGQDIFGVSHSSDNSIAKKEQYNEPINGNVVDDFTINYLKISVQSEPYLIIEENGVFRPYDDIDNGNNPYSTKYNAVKDDTPILNPAKNKLYQLESTYTASNSKKYNNIYLGTLFTINDEQIIISPPNSIYELKDENLQLPATTSVIPAKDTVMTVDYRIAKYTATDISDIPKIIHNAMKLGQISGKCNPSQDLINQILSKYNVTYTDGKGNLIKQKGMKVKTISIDTDPGVVVKIKGYTDSESGLGGSNEEPSRFVINETGEFDFNPENSKVNIIKLQVYGRNVLKSKCRDRSNEENSLELITSPCQYDVYYSENEDIYYVFYKGEWQQADIINSEASEDYISFDIKVPVEAIILYTVQVESDYF